MGRRERERERDVGVPTVVVDWWARSHSEVVASLVNLAIKTLFRKINLDALHIQTYNIDFLKIERVSMHLHAITALHILLRLKKINQSTHILRFIVRIDFLFFNRGVDISNHEVIT